MEEHIMMLFKQSFNDSAPLILFPIRHHSPACSYHLKKVINTYKPEVVLIEAPYNAASLVEDIGKEKNKPPFCLYLSYDDEKGYLGEKGEKYRAYYPLLDYSPELNAIKESQKLNIAIEFIDLAYHEKLYNQDNLKDYIRQKEDEDRLFTVGDYYQKLCEKEGCRNFNELWEKLFEIKGLQMETEAFVKSLFSYCYYTRAAISKEELKRGGDLARETYMKKRIEEAKKKYKKILVVTGGVHTIALTRAEEEKEETEPSNFKTLSEEMPRTYLMPYSYKESDALRGYEAGMAFPYFYQKVWELLIKNKKSPYEEAVLSFMINVTKQMRKTSPVSITDEMQGYYMAHGLASLRDKAFPGAFELIDGMQSAFIKGERHLKHEPVLEELFSLMTGLEMGRIEDTQNIPPIVEDFQEQCKRFKISLTAAAKKEIKLDIYQKPEHQEESCFLYQMQYLNTQFCSYEKSQEERTGVGRILLRESWQYWYTSQVYAALIDQSVYGGTVRSAAFYLLTKALHEEQHQTKSLVDKLELAEKMGLDELYADMLEVLKSIISLDMNFSSVAAGLIGLARITERMQLKKREETDSFKSLKLQVLRRMILLMDTIRKVSKDEEEGLCKQFKFLYEYFIDEHKEQEEQYLEEKWLESVKDFFEDKTANSLLVGVMAGILLKKDKITSHEAMDKFEWYLEGSETVKKEAASFLKGFFKIAKDIIFIEPKILEDIDLILQEAKGESFLEILPDLALAFTYFLPFEMDKIARKVADFYQVYGEKVLRQEGISPKLLEYIREADQRSYELMNSFMNINEEIEGLSQNVEQFVDKSQEKLEPSGQLMRENKMTEEEKLDQLNKWRLILGRFAEDRLPLNEQYIAIDESLRFLYDREYNDQQGIRKEDKWGDRGDSILSVPEWLSKIRKLFPKDTVEILQKQALERYQITELLMDKEILEKIQPDMTLLKNILAFKDKMRGQVVETARKIVKQVVDDIKKQMEKEIKESFTGRRNPYKSSQVRTMRNFDFKKTVRKNLKHYDLATHQLIPEKFYFCSRVKQYNPYHILIAVDESGSMMDSVIYSAVMAGIFSGLSMLKTELVIFDTNLVDLTDYIQDPVEVLMKVQLGGGTNISKALDYLQSKMTMPQKTIVVLVSDLYDGYDYQKMYKCVHDIIEAGANMFVLPALDYEGNGSYDRNAAQHMANLGAKVAAITPKELANWIAKIVL